MMITDSNYSILYDKSRNVVHIYLPQTADTLMNTVKPIQDRKVDVSNSELSLLLVVAKQIFAKENEMEPYDNYTTAEYRGFVGSFSYSTADEVYYGKVLNTEALISYEGKTGYEVLQNFYSAVDEYMSIIIEENTNGITSESVVIEKKVKGNAP